jgi:starch phosphorylase
MEVRRFTILPRVPERLARLRDLAYDLWWVWNTEAVGLFRRIDADLFSTLNHNTVRMLGVIDQRRLEELARDEGFLSHLDQVWETYEAYRKAQTWFVKHAPATLAKVKIAYFSAEFGLHESFPIYSGGLGILAGDHLKSASDLGVPLVGVGLMYQHGYFRQYLNADGWQQETYPENDFHNMCCQLMRGKDGEPLQVAVEYPGRMVYAQVWRTRVGRVTLYLLDANVAANNAEDRKITAQLYGGDQDMRIRQELLLGVGGLRALVALGEEPTVCHMNEGHSAFLGLERVATIMERHNVDFHVARQITAAGGVFTTHTPVEAGNDHFPPYLVESYMGPFMQRLKLDSQAFLALGRQRPHDHNEPFCMTVLALRLANHCNGVSKLHGKVSRRMWRNIWPELPETEVPISSITNGIHVASMLNGEMKSLYDRYLGHGWMDRQDDPATWKRAEQIPDAELWRIHERHRALLVSFVRARMRRQLIARGAAATEIAVADEVFDPESLTIGFARRFATYKRGNLLFRDLERLARIVNDAKRPVQVVFAGKAHPRDHGGKELIAQIVHAVRRDDLRRKIVFVEDYDINVARHLVQGVDVWLNNPRRPLEASGTSGMKVPINGGLNMSVLDGWWCEAYDHRLENGWAIGAGEEYSDLHYQDEVESRAIYDLLEKEIAPLFYDRGADRLPRNWIRWMKQSIATIGPAFNTHRMVADYCRDFYLPAAERFLDLTADDLQAGVALAGWMQRVEAQWTHVAIANVAGSDGKPVQVGDQLTISADVKLGELTPTDVEVELYFGEVDAAGNIANARSAPMTPRDGRTAQGAYAYVGKIPCQASGQHGFAVRVRPKHRHYPRAFEPGLLRWS